ncbi:MAG TPA: hypothetical protein PKV56_12960 [Burkholderiaceae bacterium]|nr:hypothetical protein [Burkholderiaceae bacterium]
MASRVLNSTRLGIAISGTRSSYIVTQQLVDATMAAPAGRKDHPSAADYDPNLPPAPRAAAQH